MKVNFSKVFTVFLFLFFSKVSAQELPPVRNFSPKIYNAQNQNWSITQGKDKLIYIANNEGLLVYNGASWQLYTSPNETIIRSVKAIENKIFTGSYMEFGYWLKNDFNQLYYTSLSEKIKDKLLEDEQFWNIEYFENKIVFQSLNNIYIYDNQTKQFEIINSKTGITKMFKTDDGLYFQKTNQGLFKIENGQAVLVSEQLILKENRIINLFKNDNRLLVQTQNNGLFKLTNSTIQKWNSDLYKLYPKASVYNSIQLKNGDFVFGTIANGMLLFDKNGRFKYQLNQQNGLFDNTVLSLFEDAKQNIWLGLDNGISLVNQNSPIKIFNDFDGQLGSVYASQIYEGKLYLGTNQGLYFKNINQNSAYELVKGTQGQVWSLNIFDNTLFCGHDTGTFTIKNGVAKKITSVNGTWNIKRINNNSTELLQGNYDGLYVLHKKNGNWKLKNKLTGFNVSARFFEILDKTIFVNHEYKGVVKLNVDKGFKRVVKTEKTSIGKSLHSGLSKFLNTIYFADKNGIFKYGNNTFKKDNELSVIYNDGFVSGKLIVNDELQEMWAFTKQNIVKISPSQLSSSLKIKKVPLTNVSRKGVEGYENILNTANNEYLLCSASGYFMLNIDKIKIHDFKITINEVSEIDIDTHQATIQSLKGDLEFPTHKNNINFTFNTTEFNAYFNPVYQYKLIGNSNEWSDWSSSATKLFENLPPNKYEFLVRAKIGNTLSENTANFSFTIQKPWYATNTAMFLYVLGVLLFSLMMHTIYRTYYKRQQKKLVEENEKELRLTQLKNEKELIKIRNEKLREDFKTKSKELASSIMNVVRKNELLADIKNQLQKATDKEVVYPVIKTIDKNLKDNADWEFFQEAFNNADSEFLKRLKSKHPKLTPNDLKLCAYLRLNLSSKEIAPLFNISPRSVEIKRYRLRKKMNLLHEENLSDYILNL